jgi:hypothetical protein
MFWDWRSFPAVERRSPVRATRAIYVMDEAEK